MDEGSGIVFAMAWVTAEVHVWSLAKELSYAVVAAPPKKDIIKLYRGM